MKQQLDSKLRAHYLSFGTFTYPGLYEQKLIDDLPSDIRKIGLLVRQSLIHRTVLAASRDSTESDAQFEGMQRIPWWRQAEDDILPTAAAMLAELYRRDERGFVSDRLPENKLILTCRFVSILVASILKSKGIPARVRSGNASYFEPHEKYGKVSWDHWINQYWSDKQDRWITIDVDASLNWTVDFDPYDVPDGRFDFPGKAWLDVRSGKVGPDCFYNTGGERGLIVVVWSLFYDFHSLMNNEMIYLHAPRLADPKEFPRLKEAQLKQVDELARLMTDPDANFDELREIYETNREFRLLSGALL